MTTTSTEWPSRDVLLGDVSKRGHAWYSDVPDVWLGLDDDGVLRATVPAYSYCPSCGGPIGEEGRGPVTWVDHGEVRGGWSHQHGCGAWVSPVEVEAPVADDDDIESVASDLLDTLAARVREVRRDADKDLCARMGASVVSDAARLRERMLSVTDESVDDVVSDLGLTLDEYAEPGPWSWTTVVTLVDATGRELCGDDPASAWESARISGWAYSVAPYPEPEVLESDVITVTRLSV